MVPSEQGATHAAPVIHNRIVGKLALFDGVPGGFDTLQQRDITRNLHSETGVIHRPCYLVGVGTAVISLPSSHEGAERRKALG